MSTIESEKGKFYKTRDGKKAECVHTNIGGCFPFLFAIDGVGSFSTKQNGSFYHDERGSEYDIISEWKDERVVWVVYVGWSGVTLSSTTYSDAFHWYTNLGEHPDNSITRVVIQDGHVDTE